MLAICDLLSTRPARAPRRHCTERTFATLVPRRDTSDPECSGSLRQTPVIGDDPFEFIAQLQGRGQVQGVQAAERHGIERGSPLAKRG